MAGSPTTTTTSTRTAVIIETVTHTLVAIGGVIQNVIVRLDNGNGHLWDYSTKLVTGDRVITIIPSTNTECATIYVYGDVTLTTETTLITGDSKVLATGLNKMLSPEEAIANEERLQLNRIVEKMIRSADDLQNIYDKLEPAEGEFDPLISV